jgi:hypothetical protein
MRSLIFPLVIFIAASAAPARAQQLPDTPPAQWSITIRAYGTTNQPGRDDLQISIHTNGKLAASIQAKRPIYDERGNISLKSPEHQGKLDGDASGAIYSAARSVILSHRVGEEPRDKIDDGDSLEITVASFDRKISATFDNSSAVNSKELAAMLKVLQPHLPKAYLPPMNDGADESEQIRRK